MANALVLEKITSDFAKHILLLLRDTSRSHIVLAIVDDPILRSEAMGELGDHLKEKYALYDFDYAQKGGQSLPRFCREKAGNAVFAFGLAELKQRDAEKYNDALHFLNAHREDIRDSKTTVVLWLNTGVYRDVLQQSPDFADWCISVPFKTTEEENDLLRQAQRFEEMLARPNLNMALAEEFLNQLTTIRKKQLAYAQRRFGQMRYKREVTVFIASAGDVAEERAIVRAVCDELNRKELVGSYGMTFKAVGWEDVMPSPGRPQETINRRVEDCDVFVCVFNKRFGSFTGKEESGTVEEFRLAFDNWSRSGKPHVMVYFKEIKIGSLIELKDEQLQKVLEFKDWIGKEKNLLYAGFTTSDDFRQRFSADMERWIVENAKAMTPEERKLPVQKSPKTLEIPAAYKTWVIDHCSYMGIDRLKEKGEVIQVRLPEIFIPLYAYPPAKKLCPPGVDGVLKKTAMPEQLLVNRAMGGMGEREQVRDIEELAGENRYLLIEGHPGSGKTTLLKHLSYSLVQNVEVKGLSGFLPILIFLKDVRGYFEKNKDARPKASTAEEMMAYYFNETENGLDVETALAFCEAGRAVFLLDGLDEIAEGKDRDLTVASFADFMGKRRGVKVVFSGRAHSMDGAVIERFGDAHLSIQSLNMEQVQDFIRKWFAYIHHQGSKVGARTAEEMIGSVKTHQGIDAFVGNPLMLTAICILYYDGRELPDQRAELYKRFVDNLLYKRFPRPEKVYAFLKKLAFEMHARGVRGVDRITAVNTLKSIYEQDAGESPADYKKRMEDLFDEIEPGCGLLKFEHGEYNFWHLIFQEFLTATYLVDENVDSGEIVKRYWTDERYKEVIELYVGYLSIFNKGSANKIIGDVIAAADELPYKKWLLASQALLDVHKDRRNKDTLEGVRNRLKSIISKGLRPDVQVEAGETLGWLGDDRDLKAFVKIKDGEYVASVGLVTLKGFEIGRYLVTNSWFEEFIAEDGYKNRDFWSDEGKKWLDYTRAAHPGHWNERKWRCPNGPVVGVSWYEAYAFTRWLSVTLKDGYTYHLPNEGAWEAATSGLERRKYPWGNEWDMTKCNNRELNMEKTSPVGVFQKGNTPDGISDMAGNVWEWTVSDYHSLKMLEDFAFDEEVQKIFDARNYVKYLALMREKNR